jgi:hypothetical protein
MIIANNTNNERDRMWPSLGIVSSLYNWACFIFICSLVAGVISSALIIWSSNIKEEYLKRDLAQAGQVAAEANQKAEEEKLERIHLEAQLAPRTIEQRESAKELSHLKDIKVIIESLAESEPWKTAGQVAWLLNNAKWDVLP